MKKPAESGLLPKPWRQAEEGFQQFIVPPVFLARRSRKESGKSKTQNLCPSQGLRVKTEPEEVGQVALVM